MSEELESLTKRELEICIALVKGACNKTIAKNLCVSLRTVEKHLSNAYEKLGLSSRTQLVLWYMDYTKIRDTTNA